MFENVRECSEMFGECSGMFCGRRAPSCGWLALLLLKLARLGMCRHNSFGFDPTGKAACCNSEKGKDIVWDADAEGSLFRLCVWCVGREALQQGLQSS